MTETPTGTPTGTFVPVTDEMVETAAAAIWNRSAREIDGCPPWDGRLPPNMRHSIRSDARAALAAVAPLIAAAALRDAADDMRPNPPECDDDLGIDWGDGSEFGWHEALDALLARADILGADRG